MINSIALEVFNEYRHVVPKVYVSNNKRNKPVCLIYIFVAWFLLLHSGFAATYEFGEGRQYSHFRKFNWENLKPSDLVKIYRNFSPYKEKLVLNCSGTRKKPIIIRGIPDKNGELPVIDGFKAVYFQKLCNEDHYGRGLIIVGDCKSADFITIENLELKNANFRCRFFQHLLHMAFFFPPRNLLNFSWECGLSDLNTKYNCR